MTSPLLPGGSNWQNAANKLRNAGYSLSNNPVMARLEAKKAADAMGRGSLTDLANRQRTAEFNRRRLSGQRAALGMTRVGSDMQMALPKIRQPLSSIIDKGIPFNINDPKELIELRRWCRLFYSTHDLVPLLVDIYSHFPVTGLELQCKDRKIEEFYTQMFLDDLNYEEFLPEAVGREYFVAGEVTTLAHFNEQLGVWSSEEVLNPDMVAVSKSLFVDHERVQLLVKELVENLRQGPQGMTETQERPSEKLERNWEYCCTPQTKVLTADLQWVPVRSLRVGDDIIGFDELAPGGTRGNGRAWRNTKVTATSIISAPTYEVNTDRGVVTCTGAQMWLVDKQHRGMQWARTDALQPGDQIRYMGDWEVEDSQDVGYVSGIFDGEGWLTVGPHGYWLGFDQKPGPVLDKAVAILEARKFQLSKTPHPCGTVAVRVLGGVTEIMRCLGIFRPVRLLPKFYSTLDGRKLPRKQLVEVISVEECGVQDVVALATSTKTLMAEGMFSHNTQLAKYYPEIIQAAARDDGLDISDALVSRLVNKASPWDTRGTPPLLRSFRTLLMEEELNAAQDAVASRLYAPMILATMGIENMGNDEPWIPGQAELDDLRNDLQTALAADFKLMVHNFGVKVESVFGRESVPNFDSDYDRIDAKLMQAWGIGQALIMGGTGAGGAYASSALNREVCEQLMMRFQKKVIRHMRKRMEVIAEAQEHYDYELKGGLRVPLYREIVEEDPETGEQRIVRVPKLLIPDVHFATLNLRDENQERAFVMQLKQAGVPISDKALGINIQVDFEQELEREAKETVDKGMAKAQAYKKMQDLCDLQGLPYPPELSAHLQATLQLRMMLAQTEMTEDQTKQMEQQMDQMSPAGMVGALPGTQDQTGMMPPPGADPGMGADPEQAQSTPPSASGPGGEPMMDPGMEGGGMGGDVGMVEPPRNRQRPAESDEMRANAPRAAGRKTAAQRWAERIHGGALEDSDIVGPRPPSKFELGPSSFKRSHFASQEAVEAAVQRRASAPRVSDLVRDPDFYRMVHGDHLRGQIQADYAEIRAGGAPESARELRELVERYEDATGVSPRWD